MLYGFEVRRPFWHGKYLFLMDKLNVQAYPIKYYF